MFPCQASSVSAPTSAALIVLICSLGAIIIGSASEDHEHAKFLKSFVPEHPHLHDLVDKTHAGDLDAKHQFERESLSVRSLTTPIHPPAHYDSTIATTCLCMLDPTVNKTRSNLPAETDEEHVVLHFLDDYTAHVTGGTNDHKFMTLEPFIAMLSKEDALKVKLVELGKKLERAECDYTCLGDQLTQILNDSIDKLSVSHTEL